MISEVTDVLNKVLHNFSAVSPFSQMTLVSLPAWCLCRYRALLSIAYTGKATNDESVVENI